MEDVNMANNKRQQALLKMTETGAIPYVLMIGGFISAMATFATTTMASSVTDIGIGTHRLFLLRHRELVFAAIAESSTAPNTRFTSMNEFLHAIAEAFEIVNDIRKVSGTLSAEAAMKFFEKSLDSDNHVFFE